MAAANTFRGQSISVFPKNTTTLKIWDRQQVLSDMVRVIRQFRPDILITRFSPIRAAHEHPTASTVLALEAFELAGDPKAFTGTGTEAVAGKTPSFGMYQSITRRMKLLAPSKCGLMLGAMIRCRGNYLLTSQGAVVPCTRLKVSVISPIPGRIGPRIETFQLLDGAPMTNDILDGVDTTWNRVPGGAKIDKQADEIIAQFDPLNPATSVPEL